MNIFKTFILLNFILLLVSCSSIKETFVNEKKNNTDEFLVEKKSPLVIPPDYNELPIPIENREKPDMNIDEFKTLITQTNKDTKSDSNEDVNKNFEQSLLEKIKKN